MLLRTVEESIEVVYRALQNAVEGFGDKQSTFADAMGKPGDEVSRRLNRKIHNGDLYRAYLDYVGFLRSKPDAFRRFVAELAADIDCTLVDNHEMTDEERVAHLGKLATEEAKRAYEKAHGLRAGSLG